MNIYSEYKNEIEKYYQIVDVTHKGMDYVLDRLKFGQTLSRLVARYVPIESGTVETFVHRSVDKHSLNQFEVGGIGRKIPESFKSFPDDGSKWAIDPVKSFYVVPIIQTYLVKENKNVCILEHIDARPSDSFIQRSISTDDPVITLINNESDVYYFIDNRDYSTITIRETFSFVSSWSEIIFLSSISKNFTLFEKGQKVEREILKYIAKKTEKIILSAYDGEGYLIWHHSS